jgi:DNA-binding MarR family transcriptional regulator
MIFTGTPGTKPGTFKLNARCRAETGLTLAELQVLVAIDYHFRTTGQPIESDCLWKHCREVLGIETGQQFVSRLLHAGLVESRRGKNTARYRPTASGSAKVAAWRRGGTREGVAAE